MVKKQIEAVAFFVEKYGDVQIGSSKKSLQVYEVVEKLAKKDVVKRMESIRKAELKDLQGDDCHFDATLFEDIVCYHPGDAFVNGYCEPNSVFLGYNENWLKQKLKTVISRTHMAPPKPKSADSLRRVANFILFKNFVSELESLTPSNEDLSMMREEWKKMSCGFHSSVYIQGLLKTVPSYRSFVFEYQNGFGSKRKQLYIQRMIDYRYINQDSIDLAYDELLDALTEKNFYKLNDTELKYAKQALYSAVSKAKAELPRQI